jgi:hypothetical protein
VTKIKKELIQKAKIKKAYSKIKAAEQSSSAAPGDAQPGPEAEEAEAEVPEPQIHPQRQAMLEEDEPAEEETAPGHRSVNADRPRRPRDPKRGRKPGYYDKALAEAEHNKAEQEAREKEMQRRTEERNRKVDERERFRRAVVKAKKPGRDGQRRLGRESGLLLEKVKRMVNNG